MQRSEKARSGRWMISLGLLLSAALPWGCAVEPLEEETIGATEEPLVLTGITLQTVVNPRYLGAQNNGGGSVNATATVAQAWETFRLDDINGGDLVSGDSIFLQAGNGQYFQAANGGGSTLNAASNNRLGWETFRIVKPSGGVIRNGDAVAFQASNGTFIRAQNGGGAGVDVQGAALSTWEQFRIQGLPAVPACSGIANGDACCPASCGACGGTGCGSRPGGAAACCTGSILASGVSCSGNVPPCIITGGTTPPPARKKVIGYVPNWYGSYASWVNRLDWAKLTHVNLAFATADSNGNLQLASSSDLDTFVAAAHARGVKVFPSLGGAGGDATIAPWYTPSRVDAFVDRVVAYAKARNMDGIDVDQESGSTLGANYNTFIGKLKAKAAANGLEISAAVAQTTSIPASTLQTFDFINLMSYDNAGTWSNAGEHSSYSQAQASINFYLGRGVAPQKIVLGVPFYGYCWGNCGNGQTRSYILYKDILARFPAAAGSDWISSGGAQYSYNGVATMTRKTDLAEQYGGIMIWEMNGDVTSSSSNSLLRAIDAALP